MTEPVSGRQPVLALLMPLLSAAALVMPALGAQAAAVLTTLHSFQVFTNGASPNGLVQGSDGYFYGTTASGGGTMSLPSSSGIPSGYGTVFRISTNGVLTTLYSFTGTNDGAYPSAALAQASDGYFYGTTCGGGRTVDGFTRFSLSYGTVFKISTNGVLTTLDSFTGTNDGAYPSAALVQASDGYFYGTTSSGGAYTNADGQGYGTVFKISTTGELTTLYSFTGGDDGAYPQAALVQGNDGRLYGTTSGYGDGGAIVGYGTVFQISTAGALTTLYSFTGGNDGANPLAALVQGSDGYFYGTTSYGGGPNDWGTVFKISTTGALTSLYSFTGGDDGANPNGLVQGSDGYFYGTTFRGGTNFFGGTVFKISTNGTLTSLYSFHGGNDGAFPSAALVQGIDGYFYGTAEYQGHLNGWGTRSHFFGGGAVFKISTNGGYTTLYSLPGDGAYPSAGVVQGKDGNFYGTTANGGADGCGTVFNISTNGALTHLYSFGTIQDVYGDALDGGWPVAGLVQGSDGNYYGTTSGAGTNGNGTVFKVSTNGALTTLYSFGGPNGLVQGSDDSFYGTTGVGGSNGAGTVFRISTSGALTTLYAFRSITNANGDPLDGAYPNAALVQGSDGNYYGTTSSGGTNDNGTVFKIGTSGALTSLYSFTGGNDGANPRAALVQGSDGYLYGTTSSGGTYTNQYGLGYGTVFKISPNGALTTLYAFGSITNADGAPLDGANPEAALVQASDGYFYGTTFGANVDYSWNRLGQGTTFKISTNGALTTLYSFTGGNDGGGPNGLVQGRDGDFYGTASSGGAGGAGTVFRLTIVPEPQLTIIPSGPYVILTWPTGYAGFDYTGYVLQSTTNLGSSAVWTTNSSPPVVIGGENVVINTMSGRQRFFRLNQ